MPYLTPLMKYGDLFTKNHIFSPPPSHSVLSFRVTLFEFMEKLNGS